MAEKNYRFAERYCCVCGSVFQPKAQKSVTCSKECYNKSRTTFGFSDAVRNYDRISGNWEKYFARLLAVKERAKTLTTGYLMGLLEEQDERCKLSGEKLTCKLKRGYRYWTNASLDRIDGSKGYVEGNIQLVALGVNLSRGGLTVEEYVKWCKLVTVHQEKKNG